FLYTLQKEKTQTEKRKNERPLLEVAETKRLIERLPYALTKDQKKAWEEIQSDLTGPYVMNRLLQGDVGSGKTILAFLALILCACNGRQGALMVPTEVLAEQHMGALLDLIRENDLPVRPVLLTGSLSASAKRKVQEEIANGEADIIIGTHALIQEKVSYQDLALVITDEQHRFGVRQRKTFSEKGEEIPVLVMSATPIPRTLAIILYGDLDLSVLKSMPKDRLPIKNLALSQRDREKALRFLYQRISEKKQAYIICPAIEEGELSDIENVQDYTEKIRTVFPPSVRIASLNGKMKAQEKNRIMTSFAAGEIDILVSTTVIEVGINVPNATTILIENAERFGLSQLHQLRGRVGRGKDQSYCIFLYHDKLEETPKRLEVLVNSTDGFKIAEEDLKLRGPGELFGLRQSGALGFILADIYEDADILKKAQKQAEKAFLSGEEFDFSDKNAVDLSSI
ncbi:MAG: ATP-dependent DNA helicase RecG, partial [Lachnospiraceae bacterium]|nr:ATP-dependent DNA helicase RecG [Lachnospiraceae bacterium]